MPTEIPWCEAGPELDALVITTVMEPTPDGCPIGGLSGPVVSDGGWWVWNGMGWMPNKHPSTDWAAAAEVVEKLREDGASFALNGGSGCGDLWIATFEAENGEEAKDSFAPTAPLAICLAALEAVREGRADSRGARVRRLKNRVAKGVCPCCKRHFVNLQRHMETKHPAYAQES